MERWIGRWGALSARLLACAAATLLAGCIEVRMTIAMDRDGSGVQAVEFVLLKRELDQLGPTIAREIEAKLMEELQKGMRDIPAGAQMSHTTDPAGNRVVTVKRSFAKPQEIDPEWGCHWKTGAQSYLRQTYALRCQVKKYQEFGEGRFQVPILIRVQMPGKIVSTNGMQRGENEAEWLFKGRIRRGTTIEASAEGIAPSAGVLAAAAVLVALLGTSAVWLIYRRARANHVESGRTRLSGNRSDTAGANAAVLAEAVRCASCGAASPTQARFCRSCGAPIAISAATTSAATAGPAVRCPACARPNPAGAKFCSVCGQAIHQMAAAAAVPDRTARKAETAPAVATAARGTVTGSATRPLEATSPTPDVSAQPNSGSDSRAADRRDLLRWKAPVIGVSTVALGLGGWFAYTKWTPAPGSSGAAPKLQTVQPDAKAAEADKPIAKSPVTTPVPGAAPMARDEVSGCRVWKPNRQPNETVKWTGRCVESMAEGPGKAEWFADGKPTLVYEGTFKAGKLQGPGRMLAAGGDSYVGEFADGQRHGRGIYLAASGEKYEGEWKWNKRDGTGTLSYANGDRYQGEFRDKKRHGRGVYSRADGERYEGEYREDRREGNGVLVRADGWRYEGPFKDGKSLGPLSRPSGAGPATESRSTALARESGAPPSTSIKQEQGGEAKKTPATRTPATGVGQGQAQAPRANVGVGGASARSQAGEGESVSVPEVPPAVAEAVQIESPPRDIGPCVGLSGLRLEQCRRCGQLDRVRRLVCEQGTALRYCLGKYGQVPECPDAEARTDPGGG
jgi:hypothetical protein